MSYDMKVLCIRRESAYGFTYYLTVGKWYDVLVCSEHHYTVRNDKNELSWYRANLFKTEAELRDEKLNKLGIM